MVYANIAFEKEAEISRVGAIHNPDGSIDFWSSFSNNNIITFLLANSCLVALLRFVDWK
jgi:hypothetical protein